MSGLATQEVTKALTINEWTIFELRKHIRPRETKNSPEGAQNCCGEIFLC